MKRWNGWGNVNTVYPLPGSARAYLGSLFGSLETQTDADIGIVLKSIPASRLPVPRWIAPLKAAYALQASSTADWVHCGQEYPDISGWGGIPNQ
jgi:hypothetical protein